MTDLHRDCNPDDEMSNMLSLLIQVYRRDEARRHPVDAKKVESELRASLERLIHLIAGGRIPQDELDSFLSMYRMSITRETSLDAYLLMRGETAQS